jgi:hypothetical protein
MSIIETLVNKKVIEMMKVDSEAKDVEIAFLKERLAEEHAFANNFKDQMLVAKAKLAEAEGKLDIVRNSLAELFGIPFDDVVYKVEHNKWIDLAKDLKNRILKQSQEPE